MSSPNAKERYSLLDRAGITFHRRLSHSHRVTLLVQALAPHVPIGGTLLDVGCGDLLLAASLAQTRSLTRCVGADIWPLRSQVPQGLEYQQIEPGSRLPWRDGEFDVVALVDTLHHAADAETLVREGLRVGRRVLIKDHFEYGIVSRSLLRLLDYLGNHAYGVPTPGHYFTPTSFDELVRRVGDTVRSDVYLGVDLYGHVPLARWLLPARLHFVAMLQPSV